MDARKVAVMLRGMGRIDRRSAAARDVLDWQKRVTAELGGALTQIQHARLATIARTRLLLDHIDSELLEPRTLFAKKGRLRKDARIALDLRGRLADNLERGLAALGAKAAKTGAPLPSIEELLDQQDAAPSRNGKPRR